MRKVLLVAGLAAVALTGCSSLEKLNSEEANLVQLDSSTYRLSLYTVDEARSSRARSRS